MLYSLKTGDTSTYSGDLDSLYNYVGALSPDSAPIIDALANSAVTLTEQMIGTPIGKRSIRLVVSRGESEVNDSYFRTWFQGGASFGGGVSGTMNQWVELPTPNIDSIQSISIGLWQIPSKITLIENQDYVVDYDSDYPRIMFSYNEYLQDYFYKFKNMTVDYVGGLYENDGTIPTPLNTAIMYLTKNMFDQRGGERGEYYDAGYKILISNYRNPTIAGGRL